MNIINHVLIAIVAVLSIAAGLAKIMAVPEEVQFLTSVGFNLVMITAYGIYQLLGGFLLILTKTRLIGAVITITAFTLSTALLFLDGSVSFGLLSILPILMVSFIIRQTRKHSHKLRTNG